MNFKNINFKDIKETLKKACSKALSFVIEYKRYFLAALVFIIMMVVLFGFAGSDKKSSDKSTSGVYASYKESKNEELNTLIENYYTAYAAGDTDTLATLASPISDEEISYIQMYSQYIDSFNDLQILYKRGLTDDSYIVHTVTNVKYKDIDTAAPGMDFFYIEKNEDGALYINNLYCDFNQKNNIYEMDSEVTDLIALFLQQGDVLAKEAEINKACEDAVAEDENLNTFLTVTLKDAIVQWNTDYKAQQAAAAEEAKKAEEEAAAAAEQEAAEKEAAEQAAEEEANAYSGTVNSKANVRSEASSDSDKLGQVEDGTSITIYGEEGDFYKFDYNGTKAYITKDAVTVGDSTEESTDEETTEEDTTTTATFAAGDKVTLDSTVNIRSSMDSSSSKVAVAYSGETVEVVMSYAEGWTKVKYGKKEGYIRTDLLQ
ncbi:MAG: SH3 domain-containing protein [Pseudobutyrivibrio sp.]|nr:SH3 domain-containing protein [Pseudobutyrivibrio sp.]